MALTLDEANRIVRATIAKAQELNIRISAAVCDSGGRLIAFQRMDNAICASVYGAQGKAVASGGDMIMGQGAAPIIRNGIVEGACGVGGGTSQQDEECARAGVAQL